MEFREVLTEKMKEKNLTALDVAENIGCSKTYIYDLIRGSRRFNEEIEEKICNFLGIKKIYVEKSA